MRDVKVESDLGKQGLQKRGKLVIEWSIAGIDGGGEFHLPNKAILSDSQDLRFASVQPAANSRR